MTSSRLIPDGDHTSVRCHNSVTSNAHAAVHSQLQRGDAIVVFAINTRCTGSSAHSVTPMPNSHALMTAASHRNTVDFQVFIAACARRPRRGFGLLQCAAASEGTETRPPPYVHTTRKLTRGRRRHHHTTEVVFSSEMHNSKADDTGVRGCLKEHVSTMIRFSGATWHERRT